jgi:hypothetical protein
MDTNCVGKGKMRLLGLRLIVLEETENEAGRNSWNVATLNGLAKD